MGRLGRLLVGALAGLAFVVALPLYGLFLVVRFLALDLWRVVRDAEQGLRRRRNP